MDSELIAARFNDNGDVVATYQHEDGRWVDVTPREPNQEELHMAQLDELCFGWTRDQINAANAVAKAWDEFPWRLKGCSSPLAVQYDGAWEFTIVFDYAPLAMEPDEVRKLNLLVS
jgi:hypothetical protein